MEMEMEMELELEPQSTSQISGLWQNKRRFMAVSCSLSKACATFEDWGLEAGLVWDGIED